VSNSPRWSGSIPSRSSRESDSTPACLRRKASTKLFFAALALTRPIAASKAAAVAPVLAFRNLSSKQSAQSPTADARAAARRRTLSSPCRRDSATCSVVCSQRLCVVGSYAHSIGCGSCRIRRASPDAVACWLAPPRCLGVPPARARDLSLASAAAHTSSTLPPAKVALTSNDASYAGFSPLCDIPTDGVASYSATPGSRLSLDGSQPSGSSSRLILATTRDCVSDCYRSMARGPAVPILGIHPEGELRTFCVLHKGGLLHNREIAKLPHRAMTEFQYTSSI
jgi:hypothetical protein